MADVLPSIPRFVDIGSIHIERRKASRASIMILLLMVSIAMVGAIVMGFYVEHDFNPYLCTLICYLWYLLPSYYLYRELIMPESIELDSYKVLRFIKGKQDKAIAFDPEVEVDFVLEKRDVTGRPPVAGFIFRKDDKSIVIRRDLGWSEENIRDLLVPVLFIMRSHGLKQGDNCAKYIERTRPAQKKRWP